MPMLIYGAWWDTISDGEQFQELLVPATEGAGGARHLVALGFLLTALKPRVQAESVSEMYTQNISKRILFSRFFENFILKLSGICT